MPVIFEKSTALVFSADAIRLNCVWCERLTCASDTIIIFARRATDDFELFCRKPMPSWVNDGTVFLNRSNLSDSPTNALLLQDCERLLTWLKSRVLLGDKRRAFRYAKLCA